MKRFKYKAKTISGTVVKGEVEASNEKAAAKLLRNKDYIIISLTPKQGVFNLFGGVRNRVTKKDIVNFTRQLSTMMNAGLPITESLLILRNQSQGRMQSILTEVLNDVEGGHSLSSSLSKYPGVFSKTYVALIKSGEVGGVMDQVLAKLSESLEKQEEFSGRVKGAMIYPIIIIVGMVGVAFIMLIFVIPKLTSLYDQFDAELPLATKFLIGLSTFMGKFWYIIIAIGLSSLYLFKLYTKTKRGRKKFDEFKFKIPLVGDLQRQVILTELTRTLALMVGSHVSILESLYITSEVSENVVISEALVDAAKMVEKGFPVAYAFAKHTEAFPQIVAQMVSVGEETGKMDEVLEKVSKVFESESDQKLKAVVSAVEPTILIVLGVGVAFLVIAVIMPIYNLTQQL